MEKRLPALALLGLLGGARAETPVDFDRAHRSTPFSLAAALDATRAARSPLPHPSLEAHVKPALRVHPRRGTEELTAAARAFLRCWYKDRDQHCFWSHISLEARHLRRFPEWFAIILNEGAVPRPETVKLTPFDQEQPDVLKEEGYACMNDSAADGFCVLPGAFWTVLTRSGRWDEWSKVRKKEYTVPDDAESRVVMYQAEGEGYQDMLVALLWVKERAGWRALMFWGDV